jgi:hypothetical protein
MKESINKSWTSCSRASYGQADPCSALKSSLTRLKLIFILCNIGSELAGRSSPVLSPSYESYGRGDKILLFDFWVFKRTRKENNEIFVPHHVQKLLQGQATLQVSSRWDQQILQLAMDCGGRNGGFQKIRPLSLLKPALTSHNVTLYPSKLKGIFLEYRSMLSLSLAVSASSTAGVVPSAPRTDR